MLAKDVMSPEVVTVEPEMSAPALARLLAERMISGAPVVDERGLLIGVVSRADLVTRAARDSSPRPSEGMADFYRDLWVGAVGEVLALSANTTVRDLMSQDAFHVEEHVPVAEVIQLILETRIHRVVVTRQKKVVGIVTTTDLLRHLAPYVPGQAVAP